jgi:outer membrane protein assembly factor BamE (lipoprotein component of BamABCDE complex)
VTTRRQVLLLLGEPDGRPTLDSRFIYQTVTKRAGVRWGLFIVTMANQTGFARLGDWHKSQRLIIDFNEHGIVTNVAVDSRNCSQDPEHIIGQPDCAQSSTTLQ